MDGGRGSLPRMGNRPTTPISRRALLAGSALTLVGCTPPPAPQSPSPTPSDSASASPSPTPSPTPPAGVGPFNLTVPSTVRVAWVQGPFGLSIVDGATRQLESTHTGVRVLTTALTDLQAELDDEEQGVPDLLHNSGEGKLLLAEIADRLHPLDDLLEAKNLDGDVIRQTLFTDALTAMQADGRTLTIPYVLLVRGLWYSASGFNKLGLTPPTTWEELHHSASSPGQAGRPLFAWDEDTVPDFLDMVITCAIKEGGHEVRVGLDNLAPEAWRHPAVGKVLDEVARLVGTPLLAEAQGATSLWASGQGPLLMPASARIVRTTKGVRKAGFSPAVAPVPTISTQPTLPAATIHSSVDEGFIVPKAARNVAGGMEMLRMMLSREVASEFSRVNDVPTVVRKTTTASKSAPLASQARLLANAGRNVINWRFLDHYGLTKPAAAAMADFLRGTSDVAGLQGTLQRLCDDVRNDPTIEKYEVEAP